MDVIGGSGKPTCRTVRIDYRLYPTLRPLNRKTSNMLHGAKRIWHSWSVRPTRGYGGKSQLREMKTVGP